VTCWGAYVARLPEYFNRAVNPADAAAGATDGGLTAALGSPPAPPDPAGGEAGPRAADQPA
jgi:hypothetical protein